MRHEGAGRARRPARPLVPVVLAGGLGSRLWPLSRPGCLKPFQAVGGARSLLQETLLRARAVTDRAPVIVAGHAHRFLAAAQCRAVGADGAGIALEPGGRGTAAAVALGAELARRRGGDPLMTFGVTPHRAETDYGYIERDPAGGDGDLRAAGERAPAVLPVLRFVEKPDAGVAEACVASGRFLWNTGMFLFDARACRDALAAHCPTLGRIVADAVASGSFDGEFFRPGAGYARAPAGSFDVRVMEPPGARSWFRRGSAGRTSAPGGRCGRRGRPTRRATASAATPCSSTSRTAWCARSRGWWRCSVSAPSPWWRRPDAVRELAGRLEASGRADRHTHSAVHRPWGHFECVDEGARHRVKRLVVAPGERISLQRHARRSEHWVVVRGVAEVTRDTETFPLRESESVFIPAGMAHRLSNPGGEPLEIVEVQVGEDLGEDDIVRLEDDYGRGAAGP